METAESQEQSQDTGNPVEQQSVADLSADDNPWFLETIGLVYRNKHLRWQLYGRVSVYILLAVLGTYLLGPVFGFAVSAFAVVTEKALLDRAAIAVQVSNLAHAQGFLFHTIRGALIKVGEHEEQIAAVQSRLVNTPCEFKDFTIIAADDAAKKGN